MAVLRLLIWGEELDLTRRWGRGSGGFGAVAGEGVTEREMAGLKALREAPLAQLLTKRKLSRVSTAVVGGMWVAMPTYSATVKWCAARGQVTRARGTLCCLAACASACPMHLL